MMTRRTLRTRSLYEIVVRLETGDEHVMANYFPVVLDQAGHQWLLGLPENSLIHGKSYAKHSSITS